MGCGGLSLHWTLYESSSSCVLCIICRRQGGYTENLLWLKGSNVSPVGVCLDLSWFPMPNRSNQAINTSSQRSDKPFREFVSPANTM